MNRRETLKKLIAGVGAVAGVSLLPQKSEANEVNEIKSEKKFIFSLECGISNIRNYDGTRHQTHTELRTENQIKEFVPKVINLPNKIANFFDDTGKITFLHPNHTSKTMKEECLSALDYFFTEKSECSTLCIFLESGPLYNMILVKDPEKEQQTKIELIDGYLTIGWKR